MFEIILITYLAFRNSVLAKRKQQSQVLWAIYTVVAYLACMMVGILVELSFFSKGLISMDQLTKLNASVRAQQLQQLFLDHPLHMFAIEMFGIGGYLLVRFLLEKKNIKEEPVHWMDKLGGGEQ